MLLTVSWRKSSNQPHFWQRGQPQQCYDTSPLIYLDIGNSPHIVITSSPDLIFFTKGRSPTVCQYRGSSVFVNIMIDQMTEVVTLSDVSLCQDYEWSEDISHKSDGWSFTGIAAGSYHAGLKHDERTRVLAEWTSGALPVVAATIAFGMGIDKAGDRMLVLLAYYHGQSVSVLSKHAITCYVIKACHERVPSKHVIRAGNQSMLCYQSMLSKHVIRMLSACCQHVINACTTC